MAKNIEYNLVDPLDIDDGQEQHEIMIDDKSTESSAILQPKTENIFEVKNSKGIMYKIVHLQPNDNGQQLLTTTSLNNNSGNQSSCQFYLFSNQGNDFVTSDHRAITPKEMTTPIKTTSIGNCNMKKRDEKRRATHNEVERRRRDKINNWIIKISKILPESTDNGFEGLSNLSKGGILAKAHEYISELKEQNQSLTECLKDNEKIELENLRLKEKNDRLQRDNELLRAQIAQHGIIPAPDTDS